MAAAPSPIRPEPFLAIGPSTIKEELRKERNRLRNQHWGNTTGLRQAKHLLGGYNLTRYGETLNLSKGKLRIITGFLTGHCRLRGHLHKLGIWSNDLCRFCDVNEETPVHLLSECEAVERRREGTWAITGQVTKQYNR
ncbi:PREDICTED: uncharacterized protein LOC108372329 [Rhagoletis zephyria]|uniref:uncharacterized protein LOC108372329 n=1 Tax=Rhagoletis zephyria TaxID=28612 RepID=UPI0008118F8D|nr:PREDICTED: uncharacterized protein LOC108372329 [Rhagoletis zephyria]